MRTSQGSGTSPTLSVILEHSNDNVLWSTKTTLLNAVAISTTGIGANFASDLGTANVGGAFMRLRITLGGTTPSASLQLWLTGRSGD